MPPERKPNQFARVAAVSALALAVLVVVVSIADSGGGSGGDDGGDDTEQTQAGGPSREGQRAIDRGVWIVGEGDSLTSISEKTGIDLDVLLELNPDVDPQRLGKGQRVALDQGLNDSGTEEGSSSNQGSEPDSDGDTISEGAGIGDGTGEGDGGPVQDSAGTDGTTGN